MPFRPASPELASSTLTLSSAEPLSPLINYYQATGSVLTPIILRHTRAGRVFVPFRLQLPDPVRQSVDYVPVIWSCVAWGDVALWMSHHVHQGDQIAVQGFFRRRRLPLPGVTGTALVAANGPSYPRASLPVRALPLTTLQCRHITVLAPAPAPMSL